MEIDYVPLALVSSSFATLKYMLFFLQCILELNDPFQGLICFISSLLKWLSKSHRCVSLLPFLYFAFFKILHFEIILALLNLNSAATISFNSSGELLHGKSWEFNCCFGGIWGGVFVGGDGIASRPNMSLCCIWISFSVLLFFIHIVIQIWPGTCSVCTSDCSSFVTSGFL